jgi:hypothetical protein
MSTNPIYRANALAKALESDRIAAAQIKEHIPVIRLLQLLDITEEDIVKAMQLVTPDKKSDS